MDEDTATTLRAQMVKQLRAYGIVHQGVLAAMAAVPRELFVPEQSVAYAYDDAPQSILLGQTISQPYIVARMSELLVPVPGMRVLEVGTGSGYQAAILAHLGCEVVSIERHPELADAARTRLAALGFGGRVRVFAGDGSLGWPAEAPFGGILVTAATPAIAPELSGQLAQGGRLAAPVGTSRRQDLMLLVRHGHSFEERVIEGVIFVPLIGAGGFNEAPTQRQRPDPRA
jgi:protein-L-isoaspartate(D-aspartate) O-methyltransferase